MPHTLVVRFSSLGDVVLSTVLLDALSRRRSPPRVTWVTKEEYASLLRPDPRIDEVVELRRGEDLRSLARRLEPVPFDEILDAHDSLRSRMLPWLLRPAPVRRLDKDTAARLWLLATRRRTAPLRRRMVDRFLALVDEPCPHARPRVVVSGPARERAARLLDDRKGPWLAVAPGARHAPKRWPVEHFAALVRRFQQTHGAPVVLLGGPGEEALGREVAESLPGPVLDWVGRRDLGDLAAVLRRCALLLCNDSGLLHLAEAVGTPVLALFGPTSRDWGYFPLDPRSTVIDHELPCRPCSRNGARPCHLPEQLCMTLSPPELVEPILEERWSRQTAPSR